ncbi:MAG: ribosome maturation factor RimM [Coriobacteriia bacterium]|nr:ribosome maturation factor RimM [Coriobacteriia bacterium]
MVTQRFVTIGRIKKSFGVGGDVLVEFINGLPTDSLLGAETWIIPPPLGWRNGSIQTITAHGDGFKVSFEGLESLEQARPLSNTSLVVDRDDIDRETLAIVDTAIAESTEAPTFWQGFHIEDKKYGDLGRITETIITGANDVWVVDGRYGEVLIPVIDEVVEAIDEDNNHISTVLPAGLIEKEPR